MTTFKKSDRVVYQHIEGGDSRYNGRTGVVTDDVFGGGHRSGHVSVRWDGSDYAPSAPYSINLRHADDPFATLRAKAAALRAEADALDAAINLLEQHS